MYDIIRPIRAAVFDNRKLRLTPAQVKERTGCTHIINGWVFDDDFGLCGWTIVDGSVLSCDQYRDYGFGCGKTGEPSMTTDRSVYHFLSAVPILKNGQRLERSLTPDVARSAERTAVGWLADGRVCLWCSRTKMKREKLQDKLLELGCVDGLMLDGGGSTQGDFPGSKVVSSREVATMLLFWEGENEPKGEKPMVEINAYSVKKDGCKYLTKNFQVKEFSCKDGSDTVFIAQKLPMVLQYIRMRIGKVVKITSGYRTPEHNEGVGGAEFSQHLYGTAADLKLVSGYTATQMALIAREIMTDWGGVGIYSWGIHVDVREEKADWNG